MLCPISEDDIVSVDQPRGILFAYGTLKHSPSRAYTAAVNGEMRKHPDGYAVVRFDRPGTVHGEIIHVDKDKLREYDRRETGYTRIIVNTKDGDDAWAYQWDNEETFDKYELVPDGVWRD